MRDNWGYQIAEVGANALSEEGAVLVILRAGEKARIVSRVYHLADYTNGNRLMDIVCAQQTRMQNKTNSNIYIVRRHANGITVYTERHSILLNLQHN